MEIKTQSLKELYEKDFYLWVQENLKLLKNREYDLADWENLLEEIEDMGQRYLDSAISFIAVILEHLYKLENFRDREDMGHSWKKSINNARNELDVIFERHPSIRKKSAEELPTAWRIAVKRLGRCQLFRHSKVSYSHSIASYFHLLLLSLSHPHRSIQVLTINHPSLWRLKVDIFDGLKKMKTTTLLKTSHRNALIPLNR
jgi:hypothetical protein